jgi:hypothetical protein
MRIESKGRQLIFCFVNRRKRRLETSGVFALELGHFGRRKAASVKPVLRFPQRNWPNFVNECSILQADTGSAKKIPDIVVCC